MELQDEFYYWAAASKKSTKAQKGLDTTMVGRGQSRTLPYADARTKVWKSHQLL